jgi:hypothetical protein
MLKVVSVKEGQNAEEAGILRDDLILEYDGITTSNKDDLLKLISRVNSSFFLKRIPVEINRDESLLIVMVRPGSLGIVLKHEGIELDNQSGENRSLEKANSIIRLANQQISELKQSLAEKNVQISHLEKENNRQRAAVENDLAAFSDFTDHSIMGVSEEESFETIKKNYKKLSLIYHPDKGGDPHMMKLINATFERLRKDESV